MLALGRHGSRRLMYLSALCRPPTRSASRIAIPTSTISQTTTTTPFPVTDTCPEPTCTCAPMPQGLDIDQKTPIAGVSPAYAEQVLICTGHSGWPSRIEDEDSAWFLRSLKSLLGRGGKYSEPFNNVLLTNSSLPPATSDPNMASAFLVPSFTYVSSVAADQVESLVTSHLLPASLPDSHPAPSPHLVRTPSSSPLQTRPIDEILVLICGHGSRDNRCGVLGPLLEAEFSHALERVGVKVLSTPPDLNADAGLNGSRTARIASISHIGGHKFAGNVIVYLPPSHGGALAGKGLWYRRVGTGHVQGIVEETVMKGRVIRELFAGGVGRGGEVLRL